MKKQPQISRKMLIRFIPVIVLIIIFILIQLLPASSSSKSSTKSVRHDDATSSAKHITTETQPGFTTYRDSSVGFSFDYPSTWGDLEQSSDPNVMSYGVYTPAVGDSLNGDNASLSSTLNVKISAKNGFTIGNKAGATATPIKNGNGYSWQVIATTPTDGAPTYTIGETLPIKSYTNKQGVTLYDFSWTTTGTTTSRWVIAVDQSFVTITLPAASEADNSPLTTLDATLYKNLTKSVIGTVNTDL